MKLAILYEDYTTMLNELERIFHKEILVEISLSGNNLHIIVNPRFLTFRNQYNYIDGWFYIYDKSIFIRHMPFGTPALWTHILTILAQKFLNRNSTQPIEMHDKDEWESAHTNYDRYILSTEDLAKML